jgi:hypothetical protein
MEDRIPLDLDTPWYREIARNLMWEEGKEFDEAFHEAFAVVMERYLNSGKAMPLDDLVRRSKKEPGTRARKFIAAMLDQEFARSSGIEVRYRFDFKETGSRRGRPKRHGVDDEVDARRLQFLVAMTLIDKGLSAIKLGRKPHRSFWDCLTKALNENYIWNRQDEYPMKATLERVDGRKGREANPELETRDEVLAESVQKLIDRGEKYAVAIKLVHKSIKDQGKAENWTGARTGEICKTIIRNAYDARSKAKG